MKRTLQIVLICGILGMFLITAIAAANNQGCVWGVNEEDRFDYTMDSSQEEVPSEDIYINVTDVPILPSMLNLWSDIPDVDIGFYWANDSSMGLTAIIFLGLILVGNKFAIPTGNWTLLEELIAPILIGESITNDDTYWGIVFSQDINTTHEYRYSALYAKTDGFLAAQQ